MEFLKPHSFLFEKKILTKSKKSVLLKHKIQGRFFANSMPKKTRRRQGYGGETRREYQIAARVNRLCISSGGCFFEARSMGPLPILRSLQTVRSQLAQLPATNHQLPTVGRWMLAVGSCASRGRNPSTSSG